VGDKPDLGARESETGNWILPTPDETDPGTGGNDGGNNGDRPTGSKQIIVDVVNQFYSKCQYELNCLGTISVGFSRIGNYFDMQQLVHPTELLIVEFSKDNSVWTQVGAQAKNGSTSWVTGKNIDLSDASAPWGPTIYIRFANKTNNNVNIKNLKITGTIYTLSRISELPENGKIISEKYYTINGLELKTQPKGLSIRKLVFENGNVSVLKIWRF
jgi:hypothetical protein